MTVNQCANNWSAVREAEHTEESNQEKDRYTRISPVKGAKRRNSWEGYCQATDVWGNSCGHTQPGSPPRKKGAKANLPKKPECKDTPIQKLISLVQGWDMANYKRYDASQVPTPDGGRADGEPPLERMAPCKMLSASPARVSAPELPGNGLVLGAVPRVQQHLANTAQLLPGTSATGGWPVRAGGPSLLEKMYPWGENIPVKKLSCPAEREEATFSEPLKKVIDESWDSRAGMILKVKHPPVVAGDGSCMFHEDSILYSTCQEGIQLASAQTQLVAKDIVFLSFPLSQEEVFYARMCHGFLTDVILDSIRQKDPKEITAQVEMFVQRLWTLQITVKEFVADLLNMAPFKAKSHTCETLLKWLEFTLPFAWKYSCCIGQLIRKGYYKSLSHVVLGKYLHKP